MNLPRLATKDDMPRVLELIKELAVEHKFTMLVVTHEIKFAMSIAERVLFLAQGSLVEDAKADKFFQKPTSAEAVRFLNQVIGQEL